VISRYLRWADVDPDGHPAYDEARVEAVVRPLVVAARARRGEDYRERLFDELTRELMIAFGAWIDGWSWSIGSGGPVAGWCCTQHTLFPQVHDPEGGPRTDLADADDDPIEATIARVVTAIRNWHACVVELAALFAQLRDEQALPPPGGMTLLIERGVELAASRVLTWVVERTHTEDAWYATFTQVLTWYVEAAGHDPDRARAAISDTIDGKFESWTEPAEPVATATCGEVGRVIRDLDSTEPRDATAAWRQQRLHVFQRFAPRTHPPARRDGHAAYIEERDRARDPERAERMLAALELCRDSARRGLALTFDQMCEWQAVVLGEREVGFRRGHAFAKRGREAYPWTPQTQPQFEQAVIDARSSEALAVRAARIYLDICFYHPFPDGNARAARLALDHVLTSAGYAMHAAEPVFLISRSASDPYMATSFVRLLDALMGPVA
jgi:hypothetical protein